MWQYSDMKLSVKTKTYTNSHMILLSMRVHKNAFKCTHMGEHARAAYVGYSLKISHNCFISTFQFIIHNHHTTPCCTNYAAIKITFKTKNTKPSYKNLNCRCYTECVSDWKLHLLWAVLSVIITPGTPHSMHWLVRLSLL